MHSLTIHGTEDWQMYNNTKIVTGSLMKYFNSKYKSHHMTYDICTSEYDLALMWLITKPGDQFIGSKLPNVPVRVYQLLKHKCNYTSISTNQSCYYCSYMFTTSTVHMVNIIQINAKAIMITMK